VLKNQFGVREHHAPAGALRHEVDDDKKRAHDLSGSTTHLQVH